jgi:Papain family cysteine protease
MSTIYETYDFGYDPKVPEEPRPKPAPALPTLPSTATVDVNFLPPVGKQTMPNCFVWSSAYGAATFWAAQASNVSPTTPNLQASPDYTYLKVEIANGVQAGCCKGGQITKVLSFLETNNGTPSLQAAPNSQTCSQNWAAYPKGTTIAPGTPSFAIPGWSSTTVTGPDGLNNVRSFIASGVPLVYGTYLYTDFPTYDGADVPYIGSGVFLINQETEAPAGHCMLIIGYNDNAQGPDGSLGAVYIQNSFGPDWGSNGCVWMAYPTFQAMAEGSAFYIAG